MSIENTGVVDSMGISKVDQKAVLLISDHLDWSDEATHFQLFEQKITKYLGFIRSGQLVESLPNAKGRPIRIELVQQYQPTENALRFLKAAKQQLEEMGLEFTFHPLPTGYQ